MQGTIFNIQRYSVNDGPGIRTLIFFKGCPLRCHWCSNPESQQKNRQIMFFDNLCGRCGGCADACPNGCIRFEDQVRVYTAANCNMCGQCQDACPSSAVKLVGEQTNIDEIMAIAEKDFLFYLNSGGGVTLGGGEPTMQAPFASRLLAKLKALGIHTAMETCGYARWEAFELLLPHLDLVLYDIKHMDRATHTRHTGRSNQRILDNLGHIMDRGIPVIIRIPVIPDFNDTPATMTAMAAYLSRYNGKGTIQRIDLLPYHKMGVGKYQALDCDYKLVDRETPEEELLEVLQHSFTTKGLETRIEHL